MKNTKRILTFLLACIMVLGALPFSVFATESEEGPATSEEKTWTDADYEALYVSDADGDNVSDLIFSWNAFGLKAGDAFTGFQNSKDESVTVPASGSAGDGYVLSTGWFDFSPIFKSFAKTVSYKESEEAAPKDVLVLQDSTWEIGMFWNDAVTYASGITHGWQIAPLNFFNVTATPLDNATDNPMKQTYGVLTRQGDATANLEVATDALLTVWAGKSAPFIGNVRGADKSFSIAFRHDYDLEEGAIAGDLTLDLLRDGKVQLNHQGKEPPSYAAAYDARYKGNWKNTAAPSDATNLFKIGAFDLGYRTIRIYDVALEDVEIQQNHAADLLYFYRVDLSFLDQANEAFLPLFYEALSTVQLGEANAEKAIQDAIKELLRESLYVYNADNDTESDLIFKWDAFDLKAEDGAYTAFINEIDGTSVATSTGKAGDGYVYATESLNFSKYFTSFAKTVSYEGADVLVLQDYTWEIGMFWGTELDYGFKESHNQYIAPLSNYNLQTVETTSADRISNPLRQTYGVLTPRGDATTNFEVASDALIDVWKGRQAQFISDERGADNSFYIAYRTDFNVPAGDIKGDLTMDFLRDGAIAVSTTPGTTFHAQSYQASYDARYKGNWKGSSQTAADNKFAIGATGFGYRTIRIYDVAISESQIKQNHTADLYGYYQLDPTKIFEMDVQHRLKVYTALSSIQLGDTGVADAVTAAVEAIYQEYKVSEKLKVYEALYVTDANGDGKNDLVFKWDAFDMTAEDGAVTSLDSQLGGMSVASANGKAGDGFVSTEDMLQFSNIFQSFAKTVPYEGTNVTVLQDSTWEMSYFWNDQIQYTAKPAGGSWAIAPINRLAPNYTYFENNTTSNFLCQTYGVLAPRGDATANLQVATDANPIVEGVWAGRNGKFVGNDRGPSNTLSMAIRHDYTVADGAIAGDLTLDLLRDSAIVTAAGDGHVSSYEAAYDARYIGNFKDPASSPTPANNSFTFGGVDIAYRSIRIYSAALTEKQLQQNHAADLLKYYQPDISLLAEAEQADLEVLYSSLVNVQIGDADAEEKIDSALDSLEANMAKRDEAYAFLDTGVVNFEGYATRLLGDAGLRSVYSVDCEAIDAFNQGEQAAKITEIGAIVAIKGEREVTDLDAKALGAQMSKHEVYKNGAWLKNTESGRGYLYTSEEIGKTCFALTTVFDTEDSRSKDCYETALLYRGYVVVTVGEIEYVYYLNMTSPTFEVVSMYEVAKFFAAKDEYKDYTTIQKVIDTCEKTAE